MRTRKFLAIGAAVALSMMTMPLFADAGIDAAAIYKAKCALCHGPDGAGQTTTGKSMKVRDLRSAEVQKAKDEELKKIIENGKGKMPAYKSKLGQGDIEALVKYIRDLA